MILPVLFVPCVWFWTRAESFVSTLSKLLLQLYCVITLIYIQTVFHVDHHKCHLFLWIVPLQSWHHLSHLQHIVIMNTTCFFVLCHWHCSHGIACPAFRLQCTFITNATCSFVLCHCICGITCPAFSRQSSQIPPVPLFCVIILFAVVALPIPPSLYCLSHLHCTVIQMPPVPLFYVIAVMASPVPPLAYSHPNATCLFCHYTVCNYGIVCPTFSVQSSECHLFLCFMLLQSWHHLSHL